MSPTYQSASLLVQVLDTRIDQLLVAFQDYFTGDTDEDKSISIVLFVLGTLSIPVLWFWLLRPVFNKVCIGVARLQLFFFCLVGVACTKISLCRWKRRAC